MVIGKVNKYQHSFFTLKGHVACFFARDRNMDNSFGEVGSNTLSFPTVYNAYNTMNIIEYNAKHTKYTMHRI